jgi:hypothetical protein
MSKLTHVAAAGAVLAGSGLAVTGGSAVAGPPGTTVDVASSEPDGDVDELVDVGEGRELRLRCAGEALR